MDEVTKNLERLNDWYDNREQEHPAFNPISSVASPMKFKFVDARTPDEQLVWKIIESDLQNIQLRYFEERCMNCGGERGYYTTHLCSECLKTIAKEVKKIISFNIRVFMPSRTRDQIILNDKRRKIQSGKHQRS